MSLTQSGKQVSVYSRGGGAPCLSSHHCNQTWHQNRITGSTYSLISLPHSWHILIFQYFPLLNVLLYYFLPNWWNTSWTPKPSIIYSPHLTTLPKMGHYLHHFEFLRLSVHHLPSSCAAAFIFNSCSHVFDSGRLYLITTSRLEKIPL